MLLIGLSGCLKTQIKETDVDVSLTKDSDPVKEALALVPGVSNVQISTSADGQKAYFFCFNQALDHSNPAAGTFPQRVSLRYAGEDKPVVLNTQGYSMGDDADGLEPVHLAQALGASIVEVEHRYFGKSNPEDPALLAYQYLYTEQAAEDLHAIVQMFKGSLFKTNKWIATGLSKSGITAALQAYYSDKKGWKDIDVFVPFGAPFLTELFDRRMGDFLWEKAGSNYPAGSVEAAAYERLRRFPAAISGREELRKTCIQMFQLSYNEEAQMLVREFGADEKVLTCGVLRAYFELLSLKWSYLPFTYWAPMVPDPETDDVTQILSFIFMDVQGMLRSLRAGDQTKSGYRDNKIIYHLDKSTQLVYYIQGCRELGLHTFNYAGVDGSYITADYAASVARSLDFASRYGRYASQWDGGALMSAVRAWVKTQSAEEIIFVYGTNDPWSCGAVEMDADANPHVSYIWNTGGGHYNYILYPLFFQEAASVAVVNAVKAVLGR